MGGTCLALTIHCSRLSSLAWIGSASRIVILKGSIQIPQYHIAILHIWNKHTCNHASRHSHVEYPEGSLSHRCIHKQKCRKKTGNQSTRLWEESFVSLCWIVGSEIGSDQKIFRIDRQLNKRSVHYQRNINNNISQ